MNYIESNNDATGTPVRIYYTDYGIGKPVILIHGWPLSNEMWEYQINDLVNSGHRVIAYDRRGFGKSSKPWDGYNYDTMTDDLSALIDKLKLEDITLIGFSMGGGEVVRYFSRHGGKGVTKAVLIASVTPFRLKTDTNPDGVPQEKFDATIEKIKQDRIGFIDDFGKTFFGVTATYKPLSTPLLEYYRMLCSFASPRAMQECAKAFTTTDFRNEMHTVNVPTLIIHGDEDNTVPIELTSKQSAKLIPNNTLLIYKSAPHGLFYTDKEKLNGDIIEFIKNGIIGVEKLNKS
ncbi:MAG: alpha/beta hydrolase [Flavobacteriales bacterium]|nr:alpha/beta hydrolase [Flavobacteriales bacterium]